MEQKTLRERFEELCQDIRAQCMAEIMTKLTGATEPAPQAPRTTDMETAMKSIVAYVKRNPKSRVEEIQKATGLDVKKPMAKLKQSAAFRKFGTGRATRYSVR